MPKKSFKELTVADKEYLAVIKRSNITHEEKMKILKTKYEVVGRTIRRWWVNLGLSDELSKLPKQLKAARNRVVREDTEVLLITSAQNKALINEGMWNNMLGYKNFIEKELGKKAEIVVIPTRYRNPISRLSIENYKSEEWWAKEVEDYLYYYRMDFGDVKIAADLRIRPTAVNPLSGFEPLAGDGHLVVGHPRHQFQLLSRFIGESLKTMATTGYLTRSQYSVSKSGAKGEVHHSYGFVVCEKNSDDTCYVPRKVKVNIDGEFTDVCWNVKDGKVSRIEGSEGIVWGDIHRRVIDWGKHNATRALMDVINPSKVIFHDLLDGSTFNPYEKKNFFLQRRKIVEGNYKIDEEVDEAIDYLDPFVKDGYDVYVIQSNHDQFLDRLINDSNWKNDLHNSAAYLKYAHIQQTVDLREYGNIFGYLINQRYGDKVEYVKYTEPLWIDGYLNFHGEYGSNGSRGSKTNFRKLNKKIVHAHCHSPYMLDNVTAVGVSALLKQDYNSNGPSSWAFADNIYHLSGKNQLIVYNNDYKFTNLLP